MSLYDVILKQMQGMVLDPEPWTIEESTEALVAAIEFAGYGTHYMEKGH